MRASIARQLSRGFAVAVLVAAVTVQMPLPVRAADAAPAVQTVNVEPGTHKLLRAKAAVSRVAIGDPKIADVNVVNGKELLINGKLGGSTSLLVWTRSGKGGVEPTEYRITVAAPASNDPELAKLSVQPNGAIDGSVPSLLAHRRATQSSVPRDKDAPPPADRSLVGGETQVMNVVTMAMPRMNQLMDTLSPETHKYFLFHYNMAPWANGETGRVGSPKRREIGHGALAARALLPVLPSQEDFSYTLRLVAEVLAWVDLHRPAHRPAQLRRLRHPDATGSRRALRSLPRVRPQRLPAHLAGHDGADQKGRPDSAGPPRHFAHRPLQCAGGFSGGG